MKPIAVKTQTKLLFMIELVIGLIISVAGMVIMPIAVFTTDPAFLTNPYMWGVVLVVMLLFGLSGYFFSVRPILLYRRLPDVQAETDGVYLYIHGKKEAKILLSDMDGTYIDHEFSYIMSHEFIIEMLSEQYGTVNIEVPKYGKFKLRFISHAAAVPAQIADLIKNS